MALREPAQVLAIEPRLAGGRAHVALVTREQIPDVLALEGLEQLRALENGLHVLVVPTACKSEAVSVDTAEDLEKVRRMLMARKT